MPEVTFRILWPDGREDTCYSPSTTIHEHLTAGKSYPLSEFLKRSETGLEHAARRVEAKFGFRCSSADAQAASIKARAADFSPEETVTCLSIT